METKPITVEEYARMPDPDDGKDDLIAGGVVYRPFHSARHGIVCSNLCSVLSDYHEQTGGRGSVSLSCGMVVARNPDSVTGPDASFWKDCSAVRCDHGWPVTPPDAAFEVVDLNEPYSDVMRRVLLLWKFGIGILWLVDPVLQTVTEFRGNSIQLLDQSGVLSGADVLPGFTCKVADLFA